MFSWEVLNMADTVATTKYLVILLVAGSFPAIYVDAACTFPTDFQNTWTTNSRGTWVVNSSHISNFQTTMSSGGSTLYTMGCNEAYNGYYVLKSEELFNTNQNVYTCLYIEKISTTKYIYSLLTALQTVATGVEERVQNSSTTLTGSAVCDDTQYTTSGERTYVALLSGSESQGKTTCPSVLQGTFSYIGTTCINGTYLDICTDTSTLSFQTTTCSELMMFSQNGTLYCVYSVTVSGNTYVTLYNNDPSPDGTTYFRFSCLVLFSTGTYVHVSVSPSECASGQVALTASTGGYVTVLTNDLSSACYTAPTADNTKTTLTIVAAVLGALCFIIIIVTVVCVCKNGRLRRRRRTGNHDRLIT